MTNAHFKTGKLPSNIGESLFSQHENIFLNGSKHSFETFSSVIKLFLSILINRYDWGQ